MRKYLIALHAFLVFPKKQELVKSDVVSMVTINPKSLELGELYGQFDANTAEWTDGVLSYVVRSYAANNKEHSDKDRNDTKATENKKNEEG